MPEKSRFYHSAVLAILMLTPTAADAACFASLEPGPMVTLSYDPFAFAARSAELRVTIKAAGAPCHFGLYLADEAGQLLPHLDVGATGVVFDPKVKPAGTVTQGTSVDHAEVFLGAGETAVVTWILQLAQDAVASPGDHTLNAYIVAVSHETGEKQRVPFAFLLSVIPRAQVNLAGASVPFGNGPPVETIDFGTLHTGDARHTFFQVRANTRALVTLTSLNHGVLRNRDVAGDHATNPAMATITYTAILDGSPLDLSVPANRSVDPPRTAAGISLPFDIVIGPAEGKFAGRYEDVISFDVSPQ